MDNNQKKIYMKPKERMYQYPQVINNYDVNVKVNIKKLNDNNINIQNMNIAELLDQKLVNKNKRNKSLINDKNNIFSKTDNNIKFLDEIKKKQNIKKEGLYNNMIQDLKNEFREIKQKHKVNKENKILNKEKYNPIIRNYLFNENKIIIDKEQENYLVKRLERNHKSLNNSFKKKPNINNIEETINQEFTLNQNFLYNNYNYKQFPDKLEINKNKTQNNFYQIPNDYINYENEKTKIKEQVKNKEKLQLENEQNLQNAIIYMNNKKTKNIKKKGFNLTNDFLNNLDINDDNSFINLKEENPYLDLTLKNKIEIKKKNSLTNIILNNKQMKNYITSSNNQKSIIEKSNSYITKKSSSFLDNTQKLNNKGIDIDNDIEKIDINYTKVFVNKKMNSKEKQNNEHPKLLYLDRRINKIKNQIINKNFNNNNKNIKKNIIIEKTISFSFIKDKIKKVNESNELNLNIINKIFKVQNNIILELKQNQFIIKNELIKKYKEIKDYKNICFKLLIYIKDNLFKKNNNKKVRLIQNQIIKENNILRKLFINKPVNTNSKNIDRNAINDLNDRKIFYNNFNKSKGKNNSELSSDNGRINTFENNNNEDKKRNKSFERINNKNKKDKINQNNEPKFKYINFREKKSKYIDDSNDNPNVKPGKKIKYLVKDKNNLSLTFDKMESNNNI